MTSNTVKLESGINSCAATATSEMIAQFQQLLQLELNAFQVTW